MKTWSLVGLTLGILATLGCCGRSLLAPLALRPPQEELVPGVAYTNYWLPQFPWFIHVARLERRSHGFTLHSIHAHDVVCGLAKASEMVKAASRWGEPVAALNGDFYQVERFAAGNPRGLQIVEGNLISSPSGRAVFWVDGDGAPHLDQVWPRFTIIWEDGRVMPFKLNEELHANKMVLYTADYGYSTGTTNVREATEMTLEPWGPKAEQPLRAGAILLARVREMGLAPNSRLEPGLLVLAAGPKVNLAGIEAGMNLQIATTTIPDMSQARTALGGGPILLKAGNKVPLAKPPFKTRRKMANEIRAWWDRHPRSALGWNEEAYYLVVVDGRQRGLSAGMTLNELAEFMQKRLGCTEAMNLDGGGSSSLWVAGEIRNYPSDGVERAIANGLVVVRPRKAALPDTPSIVQ